MQRMLHTMLRVGELQRSIDFYTGVLGMRVLRTLDQPQDKYTLVFLGFGDESEACVLELTYNYGVSEYDVGSGFGHIAVSVDDCRLACEEIISNGGEVAFGPEPLSGSSETIAFVVDPDGYSIELIQRTVVRENIR